MSFNPQHQQENITMVETVEDQDTQNTFIVLDLSKDCLSVKALMKQHQAAMMQGSTAILVCLRNL